MVHNYREVLSNLKLNATGEKHRMSNIIYVISALSDLRRTKPTASMRDPLSERYGSWLAASRRGRSPIWAHARWGRRGPGRGRVRAATLRAGAGRSTAAAVFAGAASRRTRRRSNSSSRIRVQRYTEKWRSAGAAARHMFRPMGLHTCEQTSGQL